MTPAPALVEVLLDAWGRLYLAPPAGTTTTAHARKVLDAVLLAADADPGVGPYVIRRIGPQSPHPRFRGDTGSVGVWGIDGPTEIEQLFTCIEQAIAVCAALREAADEVERIKDGRKIVMDLLDQEVGCRLSAEIELAAVREGLNEATSAMNEWEGLFHEAEGDAALRQQLAAEEMRERAAELIASRACDGDCNAPRCREFSELGKAIRALPVDAPDLDQVREEAAHEHVALAICRDTGVVVYPEHKGRCPTHGGDACLVTPYGIRFEREAARREGAEMTLRYVTKHFDAPFAPNEYFGAVMEGMFPPSPDTVVDRGWER